MPEFRKWALDILAEQNDAEIDERTKVYETQQKAHNDLQKQLDNLTQMRLRDMIDDQEYLHEKTRLKNEIARIKSQMKETEVRAESWIELTEKVFDFALYAHKAFIFGDAETKKEILNAIGLNQILINNIFRFDAVDWIVPIRERYSALEDQIKAFEPAKYGTEQWEKAAFAAFSPEVRGLEDLSGLKYQLSNNVVISYGHLMQVFLNFIIIALSIFLMFKVISSLRKRLAKKEEANPEVKPEPTDDQKLLIEIRDLLKANLHSHKD
jgi:large conductance mechanosensitive channel protein